MLLMVMLVIFVSKNLAVEANAENMAKLKAKQNSTAFKKGQEKEEAQRIAEKMKKIMLTIRVRAGKNGKIFGGVSSKEIAEELQKVHNISVDKKKIDLKEPIKELGTRNVDVKLFEGVVGIVRVNLVAEE